MTIASKSNTHRSKLAANTIETVPEGVFWARATGFFYQANEWFYRLLGYSEEEVQGRQTREFMTEASRDSVIHRVIPILLETGSIHDFEYQMVKKNGQVLDVALTAVSERDDNGHIIRTLSMILPISDRKRAERLESQNIYLRQESVNRKKSRIFSAW